MKNRIKNRHSLLLQGGVAVLASFVSLSAFAQTANTVAGCDPQVLQTMQAKAQAETAYDIAVTEQVIKKPDSVLAMTCFNQAAAVAAQQAGAIFSGDFTSDLEPLITDALASFYDDFQLSLGDELGVFDYTDATNTQLPSSASYDCDVMKNLWDAVKDTGTEAGIPFATLEDLTQATPPQGVVANSQFEDTWNNTGNQQIFTTLQNNLQSLTPPSVPNVSNANSVCDVLVAAGIRPGPCP